MSTDAGMKAQLVKDTENLIHHAYRILLVSSRTPFLDLDITARQAKTLVALRSAQVKTSVDISLLFKINSGAITRLVDSLEKKTLISRRTSLDDRRQRLLELTPAGTRLAEQVSAMENANCSLVLSRLSIEELSNLQTLLQKLTRNYTAR